jgi:hypothetical protein
MSKQIECLLQSILQELQSIREHIVPPAPLNPVELEQTLTKVLGVGPDNTWNRE